MALRKYPPDEFPIMTVKFLDMLNIVEMQVRLATRLESPEEIYARVYRELEPHRSLPAIEIRYCRFTSANSFIRLRQGCVDVRITDLLEGAPAPILEALAFILLAKLLRQPVPVKYNKRYRQYIHRQDIQKNLHNMRRKRGRKLLCNPRGEHYNLEELFDDLNSRFFQGLMAKPALGWSQRNSRTTLGHYDPAHEAIVISRILDRADVPRSAVEYVLFHEMLHQRFPIEYQGARRLIHTHAFRKAERQFPYLQKIKRTLKDL